MRELKFRAWDDRMYENVVPLSSTEIIEVQPLTGSTRVRHVSVVMQWTGLKDCKGIKDIYEGDIIDMNGNIVGNIYESPEIHKRNPDWIIATMVSREWLRFIETAIKRGCLHAK